MTQKNTDVRQRAKEAGVFQYQIAEAVGVSEYTILRKLRKELPQDEKSRMLRNELEKEKKEQIFRIIDQIAQEENHGTE